MDQTADTMIMQIFNRNSYRKSVREPVTTVVTDSEEDIKRMLQDYCLQDEEVVSATLRMTAGGYDGTTVSESKYFFSNDEGELKPITDIRFDGDYADQERQETFEFYDKKKITHVFSILGMHYDVDDKTVVLSREGKVLWPTENKTPEQQQAENAVSSLDKQRHLRNYLRHRK
ncbi:MAG: hypothetical protein HND56_05015 [Pseudomonadota bacterium]|nr:hypothetical protein [Pseudomonadota bacterium]QKK05087.1 MAG: hypothetical protein HND56_05015 [Pseudomonadota bacterium]